MIKNLCQPATPVGAAGSIMTTGQGLPNVPSSPMLGDCNRLTLGLYASAATTLTVFVSYDNGATWIPATARGGTAALSIVLAGAGGIAIEIVPAPNVKITSSASVNLTAYANITN